MHRDAANIIPCLEHVSYTTMAASTGAPAFSLFVSTPVQYLGAWLAWERELRFESSAEVGSLLKFFLDEAWTGRLCCVRSSWTKCAFTRLTQHRGCRGPASSSMQLKFQQSKVFVFVSPQIQFIDRLWTFQLRTERGTRSALCNGRRSCEQQ